MNVEFGILGWVFVICGYGLRFKVKVLNRMGFKLNCLFFKFLKMCVEFFFKFLFERFLFVLFVNKLRVNLKCCDSLFMIGFKLIIYFWIIFVEMMRYLLIFCWFFCKGLSWIFVLNEERFLRFSLWVMCVFFLGEDLIWKCIFRLIIFLFVIGFSDVIVVWIDCIWNVYVVVNIWFRVLNFNWFVCRLLRECVEIVLIWRCRYVVIMLRMFEFIGCDWYKFWWSVFCNVLLLFVNVVL